MKLFLKNKNNFFGQKLLWNSGAHYTCMRFILNKIRYHILDRSNKCPVEQIVFARGVSDEGKTFWITAARSKAIFLRVRNTHPTDFRPRKINKFGNLWSICWISEKRQIIRQRFICLKTKVTEIWLSNSMLLFIRNCGYFY